MFGPEERRRAVERYSATPPATARATRPGSAWNVGLRRIPGMPAVWRNPSSHWRQGPRRSSWYWAACGGSRPPNGSARASEPSTTGSRRTSEGGMAALQPRNRNAAQNGEAASAPRRNRNAGDGNDDTAALCRRVEELELENALMREVVEVRRKRPRRRSAAPVEQGGDAAGRPSGAGVFARLDDMLARHRAEQLPLPPRQARR